MIDRPTYAEINISNILYNIKQIKSSLSKGTKFMAVVKADAYGHGAVAVSKAIAATVDYLSVANIAEALELKKAGIKKPILILSQTPIACVKEVTKNDLVVTVYDLKYAKALSTAAKKLKKTAKVHLKIDTGMGRVGVPIDQAKDLYNKISELSNIKIDGVFTHLAKADDDEMFTGKQIALFNKFISSIDRKGLIVHAANSAGTLYHSDSHFDMVRVGLSMYGIYPSPERDQTIKLKPALELKTRVGYLKNVPAGTPLSYGSTHITKSETRIATLPVGYADGLPRALSNKGSALINGKKYPIVGRVCMDMTIIDVDGSSDVLEDDVVTLIGAQGKESISAVDVARLADTISYEIICGIGKRVPRVYTA